MPGVINRCRNCAHECAAGDAECPVCCGPPALWCQRCNRWLESARCPECAKRDADAAAGREWHFSNAGRTAGPFTADELKELTASGALTPADIVWKEGMRSGRPAGDFGELFPVPPPPPPPPPAVAGSWAGSRGEVDYGYAGPPGPHAGALGAVGAPALALLLIAILGAAVGALRAVDGLTTPPKQGEARGLGHALSVLSAASATVVANGFVLYAAMQMFKLQSYRIALAASALVMLPCSGCWCVGAPVGIWSLSVLARPDVRVLFRP